jgi:hypothetical protein
MQSAWFGGIIMLVMTVGLCVWLWWVIRHDKDKDKEQ